MKNYKIAVIPGDGSGPEMVREGLKILETAAKLYGFGLDFTTFPYGGDYYLGTGDLLPTGAVEELKRHDAIFLGAIGHPDVKPGILEKGILLNLRFELDQYINLRPVRLYPGVDTPLKDKGPEDINFVVVRENTEGLYTGSGGFLRRGTLGEVAIQESINTRLGVERCLRYAFNYCREKGKRKKLTLCGKTNVLTYAFDLWERTFHEVGAEFPEVTRDYAHVDAICMWMVKNPEQFDVIVTDNMFGDIITDLGAIIQGGMGIAAGGNINPEGTSMFESIGGSAPRYAGKNMINPLASICAGGMMLEHLGEKTAATAVEQAVMDICTTKITSLAAGHMGYSTSEVGDLVAARLQADKAE